MEQAKARFLVVDDEATARSGLQKLLLQDGYTVDVAADGEEALGKVLEQPPDAVVTDLKMPGLDGLGLLTALRERGFRMPVIVVTAFGDVASAVAAMRAGADDYLTKPVDFDALSIALQRALERTELRTETENLRRQLRERDGEGLSGLIGASLAMQKVYRVARQVAPARATVLITGESGTGKGELARAIHALSPRAREPFVPLHCSAIAETLLESELFGHEKGAFTGADKRRAGRFEQSNGGTLFLDEVGEIPAATQVKLLRVLQERTFERVGGNETIQIDVRVIAATNRDLAADVREGRFREDLYYRLNVVAVEMPPLRARGSDVLMLAQTFVKRFARDNHKAIEGLSDAARRRILGYLWPGNVRELENALERAVVMCEGDVLEENDLPESIQPTSPDGPRIPGATLAEVERHAILTTLEACDWSTAKAAEMLGISVRTIQYRLGEWGIVTREKRHHPKE